MAAAVLAVALLASLLAAPAASADPGPTDGDGAVDARAETTADARPTRPQDGVRSGDAPLAPTVRAEEIDDFTEIWVGDTDELPDAWTTETVDLSSWANESVCLAFVYRGASAHEWYLDDISVTSAGEAVFTEDFGDQAFPPPGWSIVSRGADVPGWAWTDEEFNDEPGAAWHDWFDFALGEADEWLITEHIELGDDPELTFAQRLAGQFFYDYSGVYLGTGECVVSDPADLPQIELDPTALTATHAGAETTTQALSIANLGVDALEWEIEPWVPPGEVAVDNGPFITAPGEGPDGSDLSELQIALGMLVSGFSANAATGFRIADDFEVPAGEEWDVNGFTVYAFSRESTTESPFTGMNYRIWDGPPNDAGSEVVYGDAGEDRLASTTWTGAYRVLDVNHDDTSRPIMEIVAEAEVTLGEGTYWLDFQLHSTDDADVVPITILGEDTTGNALHFTSESIWRDLEDTGNFTPQGVPFLVHTSDVPPDDAGFPQWLDVDPLSGAVPGDEALAVNVTFDSTGLDLGTYDSAVMVRSNAPAEPSIRVPVSLTVEEVPPTIAISADALGSTVAPGETATEVIEITNLGDPDLEWSVETAPPLGGLSRASGPPTLPATIDDGAHGAASDGVWTAGGAAADGTARFPRTSDEPDVVTLSQTVSDDVEPGSISCADISFGWTYETSFLRAFALDDHDEVLGDLEVFEVTFGVQALDVDATVDVNLHTLPVGADFTFANLTPIGATAVDLEPQDLTLVTTAVEANAPAGSILVVELHAPDLIAAEGEFFPGSNGQGEDAPTYIASEECDTPEPTPIETVSPGQDMHMVLNVSGTTVAPDPLACDEPGGPAWLSVEPGSGTTTGGDTSTVTVTLDGADLGPGAHEAVLCVSSNDAATPLVEVPVAMTVAGPDPDLVELQVTPSDVEIEIDEQQAFVATAVYDDGTVQTVTDAADWVTDDVEVITMDGAGVVTAVGRGEGAVTATFDGQSATASVTVTSPPPDDDDGADDDADTETIRLSGPNRFETAVNISRSTFGDGEAGAVVLARGDEYADALAGTALAVDRGAPTLLTVTDELIDIVADEITRVLEPGGTVYLLGGTAALDASVGAELTAMGYAPVRLDGAERIATSLAIAEALGDPAEILVTTGFDFPDALSAGAAAAHVGGAVILSTPEVADPQVQAYLEANPGATVSAVGGPAARAYPGATPFVGVTREATAAVVADAFFDGHEAVAVARHDDYPDALAGGTHIGHLGGPLLLTPTADLHPVTAAHLCANAGSIGAGFVYGGLDAITADVVDRIAERITTGAC